MATYTANYGLHQWVPEDNFLRSDFNTDFQKIDSAIKATEEELRSGYQGEVARLDGALAAVQQTLRNEFNSGIQSINSTLTTLQQAVSKKLEIVTGSFVGTAIDNSVTEQHIGLGFQPCFVVFGSSSFWYGGQGGPDNNCVVVYPGVPCDGISGGSRKGGAKIEATGFLVYGVSNYINTTYQYIAFRTV